MFICLTKLLKEFSLIITQHTAVPYIVILQLHHDVLLLNYHLLTKIMLYQSPLSSIFCAFQITDPHCFPCADVENAKNKRSQILREINKENFPFTTSLLQRLNLLPKVLTTQPCMELKYTVHCILLIKIIELKDAQNHIYVMSIVNVK